MLQQYTGLSFALYESCQYLEIIYWITTKDPLTHFSDKLIGSRVQVTGPQPSAPLWPGLWFIHRHFGWIAFLPAKTSLAGLSKDGPRQEIPRNTNSTSVLKNYRTRPLLSSGIGKENISRNILKSQPWLRWMLRNRQFVSILGGRISCMQKSWTVYI